MILCVWQQQLHSGGVILSSPSAATSALLTNWLTGDHRTVSAVRSGLSLVGLRAAAGSCYLYRMLFDVRLLDFKMNLMIVSKIFFLHDIWIMLQIFFFFTSSVSTENQ